jgi:hypothetical protein
MRNFPVYASEGSIVKADAVSTVKGGEQQSYEELKKELEQEQKARKSAEERNEELEEENARWIGRMKRTVRLLEAEEDYAVELGNQVSGLKKRLGLGEN